jgi:hypothetical protein
LSEFFAELDRSLTIGLVGDLIREEISTIDFTEDHTLEEDQIKEEFSGFLTRSKERLANFFKKKVEVTFLAQG